LLFPDVAADWLTQALLFSYSAADWLNGIAFVLLLSPKNLNKLASFSLAPHASTIMYLNEFMPLAGKP